MKRAMKYIQAAFYVVMGSVMTLIIALPLALLVATTCLIEFLVAAVDGISKTASEIIGKPS